MIPQELVKILRDAVGLVTTRAVLVATDCYKCATGT
jgi:hypothetical protein